MRDFTAIPLSVKSGDPFSLEKASGDLEQCIGTLLDLIVFTPRGSFPADPEFGFEYWNHEFSNINVREFNNSYMGMMADAQTVNEISRRQCEASLRESILTYEPRLLNPEVRIELEMNVRPRKRKSQSKYEMRILISGSIDDGLGIARPYEKRISFMVEPVAKKITI